MFLFSFSMKMLDKYIQEVSKGVDQACAFPKSASSAEEEEEELEGWIQLGVM